MKASLSAVVITRNEEANIERCLRSLAFCDEIVVVDAESMDRTRELALAFTPHVVTQPWLGYSAQKNFANTLARGQWILSVDADEVVSEELKAEITRLLASEPDVDAYTVPRRTIHLGRWIRHGGWYPNRLVRLFRKDKGEWVGADVHERWESAGQVSALESDLVHYSFAGIADQVSRNNRYSSLGAQHLQRRGRQFGLIMLLFKPLSKFLETYLLKRGFLDGYPGFIISISASYSVFLKWAKLWEMENEKRLG